jgi:hypothetical protein
MTTGRAGADTVADELPPTGEADMSLVQLGFAFLLVADAERSSGGTSILPGLAAMAVWDLSVMLILWRVFMSGGTDGHDPGSGGGGPGWRRRRPRKPPPHDPAWWPEFERQFAEHVAVQAAPARTTSQRAATR